MVSKHVLCIPLQEKPCGFQACFNRSIKVLDLLFHCLSGECARSARVWMESALAARSCECPSALAARSCEWRARSQRARVSVQARSQRARVSHQPWIGSSRLGSIFCQWYAVSAANKLWPNFSKICEASKASCEPKSEQQVCLRMVCENFLELN